MLHSAQGYHNKFYSTKSLSVYHWYFKIMQWGYMEHGLKDIKFYFKKIIAPLAICYNPPLVHDKPPGAPTFVSWVYFMAVALPQIGWEQNEISIEFDHNGKIFYEIGLWSITCLLMLWLLTSKVHLQINYYLYNISKFWFPLEFNFNNLHNFTI